MSTPSTPQTLDKRDLRRLFAGLLLSMLLAALDSTIVATALPTITSELGSPERLSWVVTAYLLAQTVVIPLYGKLGDLYGRKIGCEAQDRLIAARRERLTALAREWPAGHREQLAEVLQRLARELVPPRTA